MVKLQCSGPYWSNPLFCNFFDIRALWTERQSARTSKKIKNGGLDQYGAERFGRLIFVTVRKSVGLKFNGTYRYSSSVSVGPP